MKTLQVESSLPEGWLPEGAAVVVCARAYDDGHWESYLPEFGIAGMGGSAEAALVNVLELLDDYLFLCAREGKRFEDCHRGMSGRSALPMFRELASLMLRARLRRSGRPAKTQRYRLPLRPLGVH